MGQQQLLLVILVTILVGIATVVAINVFGTAAEDANRDAVRQDLLQGATAAQAVWTRPAMLDGAAQDFVTIPDADLLRRLGMPLYFDDNTTNLGSNENGSYSIADTTPMSIQLLGEPTSGGTNIRAWVCRDVNRNWQVAIGDDGVVTDPCAD